MELWVVFIYLFLFFFRTSQILLNKFAIAFVIREKVFRKDAMLKENLHGHYLLTSVSDKHPMTAMAFASHAVSKSDVDFELHLFNKS